MSQPSRRLDRSLLLDGLKALAAQIIVIHHLVSYGPMAAAVTQAAPDMVAWFLYYGRWAVQVFLVVAGFLTAQLLCGKPALLDRPWSLVTRRYIRLAWPFGVAVTLAVLAAELARHWTDDPILPAPAGLVQYVAHWLLMHSVLGHDALSTGVWYVAIDFQLFLLTVLLLWTSRALRWAGWAPLLIGGLTMGSLVWIRHWESWDNWAPYFYNAYGVGLLVGWLRLQESQSIPWVRGVLMAVLGVLCWQWLVSLNGRLVVILLTGALLALASHPMGQATAAWAVWQGRLGSLIHYLGTTSFALFLIHFPVSMLVNAAQVRFEWTSPLLGSIAMLVAWGISMLCADVFYRVVERQGLALSRRVGE